VTGLTNARLAEPYGGVGVGAAVAVGAGVGVGVGVGAGVCVGDAVGVGVGPPAHPVAEHASQQLENWLTHAEPFLGAVHRPAFGLIEQRVLPFWPVTQHATASPLFRPQDDRDAHCVTFDLQLFGNWLLSANKSATWRAHFTYWPWFAKPLHGQLAATAARAAATAASSLHFALAGCPMPTVIASATNPTTTNFIPVLLFLPGVGGSSRR